MAYTRKRCDAEQPKRHDPSSLADARNQAQASLMKILNLVTMRYPMRRYNRKPCGAACKTDDLSPDVRRASSKA
jgi:hypothetical protein